MNTLLEPLLEKLVRTLTSVKFWTCIAMISIALAKDIGLITPECAKEIMVALGLFMGGVALTDHGKERAKIETGTGI